MARRIISFFLILLLVLIILLSLIFLVGNVGLDTEDNIVDSYGEFDLFNQTSPGLYLISDSFEIEDEFFEFEDFEEPESQRERSGRSREREPEPDPIDFGCTEDFDFECIEDFDCGFNDFFGEPFCQEEDVYQNYKIWTCNNPNSISSSCGCEVEVRITEQCLEELICSEGVCVGE